MKKIFIILLLAITSSTASMYAQNADYYWQRAEEAYSQNDLKQCLFYCQKGIAANPKHAQCWAVIAEIYSKRAFAQYGAALDAANNALKYIDKKDTQWLAFIYNIKGNVYFKIEQYDDAVDAYAQAIKIAPNEIDYIVEYADALMHAGHLNQSVKAYLKAIDIAPEAPLAYAELAYVYYKQGDLKNALLYCDRADYLTDGRNIRSHIVRSNIARLNDDIPLAAKELAAAFFADDKANYIQEIDTLYYYAPELTTAAMLNTLNKDANNITKNLSATMYFYRHYDYVNAIRFLNTATKATTEPDQYAYIYGYIFDGLEEYDTSIKYYQTAIQTDSTNTVAKEAFLSCIANNYRYTNNTAEAKKYYRQALQLSPESGTYRMLARCYIMDGNLDSALHYMDTAVMTAADDDIPTALMNRAEVHSMKGNTDLKEADLKEALSYRDTPNTHTSTRLLLEGMTRQEESLRHYADSIEASVYQSSEDYYYIASAYAILQNKERALYYIDKLFSLGHFDDKDLLTNYRFDFLRNDADFLALLNRHESVRQQKVKEVFAILGKEEKVSGVTELPFTKQGGVNVVKCTINSLPLYFIFDTGASDVTISSVEANFMFKNGYLSESDILGKTTYSVATGEIHEGTIINLREVRIGDVVLRDVKASVVNGQNAPLLLGQTVFRRFGTLEIDNQHSVIRFVSEK